MKRTCSTPAAKPVYRPDSSISYRLVESEQTAIYHIAEHIIATTNQLSQDEVRAQKRLMETNTHPDPYALSTPVPVAGSAVSTRTAVHTAVIPVPLTTQQNYALVHPYTYFSTAPIDVWIYVLIPYLLLTQADDLTTLVTLLPLLLGPRSYPLHTHLLSHHARLTEEQARLRLVRDYASAGTLRTPLTYLNDQPNYRATYVALTRCDVIPVLTALTAYLGARLHLGTTYGDVAYLAEHHVGYEPGFYADKLESNLIYALTCWLAIAGRRRQATGLFKLRRHVLRWFAHTPLLARPAFRALFATMDVNWRASTELFAYEADLYPLYGQTSDEAERMARYMLYAINQVNVDKLGEMYETLQTAATVAQSPSNFPTSTRSDLLPSLMVATLFTWGSPAQVEQCLTWADKWQPGYSDTALAELICDALTNPNPVAVAVFCAHPQRPRVRWANFGTIMAALPPRMPAQNIIPLLSNAVWANYPHLWKKTFTVQMDPADSSNDYPPLAARLLYQWLLVFAPTMGPRNSDQRSDLTDTTIFALVDRFMRSGFVDACLTWPWLYETARHDYCEQLLTSYQPSGLHYDVAVYYRRALWEEVCRARAAGQSLYVPPYELRYINPGVIQSYIDVSSTAVVIIASFISGTSPNTIGASRARWLPAPQVDYAELSSRGVPYVVACTGPRSLIERTVALLNQA